MIGELTARIPYARAHVHNGDGVQAFALWSEMAAPVAGFLRALNWLVER